MMEMLWWMVVGHALADFALVTEFMARGKYRLTNPYNIWCPWYYPLGAHALVHGGAVALATGVWWLGVCETVAHAVIDHGKCEQWYGIHADQAMHMICKVAWLALVYGVVQ